MTESLEAVVQDDMSAALDLTLVARGGRLSNIPKHLLLVEKSCQG